MLPRFARLVVTAIMICAFLGAGLMQNVPSAQADTAGMAMMADQGGDVAPMPCHGTQKPTPCKDKVPGCMTDLGCLFVVGIPALPTRVGERFAWGHVTYWATNKLAEGVTPEPDLGPPIRLV
jgi:hypothetical protein